VVEFESQDVGVHGIVRTKEEIQACHDPYDPFALHKAALIACGIIPPESGAAARRQREDAGALPESALCEAAEESLEQILKRLGGGIYLSTQVVGIPKGSGLGTSSILAGACVTGLFEFLGFEKSKEEIYEIVLCMEQIMSTGGGWQDQVGGLTNGIKLITTKPGIRQQIHVEPVHVPESAMRELSERFALIYTGQRRLARNLLRDVVGSYIGARPESVQALSEMKPTAALMAFYLKQGDIDSFGELLNRHWELSRQLDAGCTNSCIDQIFLACDDLISAKFLAGAGGGGFLMVLLKKGVTKAMLHDRLAAIFQDSGVDVWDCAFV
jgi:fucokinase